MAGKQELIDWYKAKKERLKARIEAIEFGRERHQTMDANGQWVDSTGRLLDDWKSEVAQLEALIKRHENKPDEGIRPNDLTSENDG